MLPIQPRRRGQRDEKLTPISIRAAIGHAQDAGAGVFEGGVDFVGEGGVVVVDGGAPATGAGGVAGLEHEVWDYAVEEDGVVVAALGEGGEVGAGLAWE